MAATTAKKASTAQGRMSIIRPIRIVPMTFAIAEALIQHPRQQLLCFESKKKESTANPGPRYMMNESRPKFPYGSSMLMNACISETIVAVPGFCVKPKAITGHIMYKPPATAPVGMYRGPVRVATRGCIMFLVANPKLAKSAMRTRSVVATLRLLLCRCCIAKLTSYSDITIL